MPMNVAPLRRRAGTPRRRHRTQDRWISTLTCWWYFGLLRRLLAVWPWPVWHAPAVVLALIRLPFDREARHLSRELSVVLGEPATRGKRLRVWWALCYYREVKLLLYVQAHRLTKSWARRYVHCSGTLPAGGAILSGPHHAAGNLGLLRAAPIVGPMSGLTIWRSRAELADVLPLQQRVYDASRYFTQRTYGPHLYHVARAGRQGVRLLNDGGYLAMSLDGVIATAPASKLFGRATRLPRGPVWFARRSGKPLVPYIVTAERGRLRLWIGEPVPATLEARAKALEACIRRAPGAWDREMIHMWRAGDAWESATMDG